MRQYNIAEAKSNFSALVKLALTGEEVIIAKDNHPLLKLIPITAPARGKRKPGSAQGQILIAPDFKDIPEGFEGYV